MKNEQSLERSQDCVRRLQEGERAAFDELVEMYKRKAFSLVFNIVGNVEDARDIVQEGFLKVYTGIVGFRSEANFFTWFYRILVNLSRDHLRRKMRAKKVFVAPVVGDDEEERPVEIEDETLSPERLVLTKELGSLLDQAVNALPGNQKMAFCMKYYEGMKVQEISGVLKCRPSTVKVHIFRASEAVARKMEPYLKK